MEYLTQTNWVYVIDEDHQEPVHIFMDAYTSDTRVLCQLEECHAQLPPSVWKKQHTICNLEALNAAVAIRRWALTLQGKLANLHSDSTMVLVILKVEKG